MSLQFDHVVLLVNDLEKAARDFATLGFTILQRADINASHGSTMFRFVSLADGSYILLTAFTGPEAMARHRLGPVLEAGEGHADWSFAVADASALGAAMRAAGKPVGGPVVVSNVVEGGHRWGLDLLMLGRGAGGDVALPFVVSDNEGRNHRVPGPSIHANGASAMAGIRLSSVDGDTVVKTLAAIGGKDAGMSPANAGDRRVDFGPVWIDVAPENVAGSRAGGGIVEVVLTSTDAGLPAGGRVLDLALAHGAPIRLIKA
ncbi:VOC family protein [Mesorhizobium sp. J428]|uniref:VOC family protein n=1 Tax=Mesorhizobium sp. J428 TaxID=2898440 RepID=UPI00215178BD|nr:VOC family protein [Mesorhizobium sp. J428]MCR5856436.1 VOC family protein [Mesorhizobium sp. J428]